MFHVINVTTALFMLWMLHAFYLCHGCTCLHLHLCVVAASSTFRIDEEHSVSILPGVCMLCLDALLGLKAHFAGAQSEANKLDNLEVPGMFAKQPASWQRCPCSWRTCQAVMGDACLGMTRLRAAATNSHSLLPFHTNGLFIPDEDVRQHVATRQNMDVNLLTPCCAHFQAVGSLSKRSKHFDIMGIAALVCRHEFVMAAVNLFTEENFAYYDIMLDRLLKQYSEENGKQLICFFLDIACQFKPYWDR